MKTIEGIRAGARKRPATRTTQYLAAPRIEVVLVPDDGDPNRPNAAFELWLVLHVPDAGPPNTVFLRHVQGREAAIKAVLEIYTSIGDAHAFDGTLGIAPAAKQ